MMPTRTDVEAEIRELEKRLWRLRQILRAMQDAPVTKAWTAPSNPDVIVTYYQIS